MVKVSSVADAGTPAHGSVTFPPLHLLTVLACSAADWHANWCLQATSMHSYCHHAQVAHAPTGLATVCRACNILCCITRNQHVQGTLIYNASTPYVLPAGRQTRVSYNTKNSNMTNPKQPDLQPSTTTW
jgi:hypothetical protein